MLRITDDWNRTADLCGRKRPLNQLSHNHCPSCCLSFVRSPTLFEVVISAYESVVTGLHVQDLAGGQLLRAD